MPLIFKNSRQLVISIVFATAAISSLYIYYFKGWSNRTYEETEAFPSSSTLMNPTNVSQDKSYAHRPDWVEATFPTPENGKYVEWNEQVIMDLVACTALKNCGENQEKVIILGNGWFEVGIFNGFRGGESVWGVSMFNHLRALGYSMLVALSFEEILKLYRRMPNSVMLVIRDASGECHDDPNCVKSPSNPTGIPAWKIFEFSYWPVPAAAGEHRANRLGGKWILTSHPDDTNPDAHNVSSGRFSYIGFSFEEECSKMPAIPLHERENQIYMFMKETSYVSESDLWFSWKRPWFAEIAKEFKINFIGAWFISDGTEDIEDPANGIINLHKLDHDQWGLKVRESKALLGIGNPWWSPSPWYALCMGVPVIHPIRGWDHDNPSDRSKWDAQQPSLTRYSAPYVYHVHKYNRTELDAAISAALNTEIPKFIPPFMTEAAVRSRMKKLLETDWKAEAAKLLEERINVEGAYTFEL